MKKRVPTIAAALTAARTTAAIAAATAAAVTAAIAALGLAACGGAPRDYPVVPPALPPAWETARGGDGLHWRVQWLAPGGVWESRDIAAPARGAAALAAPLDTDWAAPVLAWPYWPGRDLAPGMTRPAGAIVPWDIEAGEVRLSWQGGVDAIFWRRLAEAAADGADDGVRQPWRFDWPRFRALWSGDTLPEAARRDPWLVDWAAVARRTVESGFDRRRIRPRDDLREILLHVPIPAAGAWTGPSPFADPVTPAAGGFLRLLAGPETETWVSAESVARYTAR